MKHSCHLIERLLYMNLLFLASFILFMIWFTARMHVQKKKEKNFNADFWKREAEANAVRRKPLDQLHYITIPLSGLPLNDSGSEKIRECIRTIRELSDQRIVNLNGISNTDLKLTYGAPNLPLLSEYDENFTLLISTLQKWASLLYDAGQTAEAQAVLEFAVSAGSDISGSYKLLASIYRDHQEEQKIQDLIRSASELSSPMKDIIVRTLQESCP